MITPGTDWSDSDLLAALDRYQEQLSNSPLSLSTVESDVYYGRLFLRWRTGD